MKRAWLAAAVGWALVLSGATLRAEEPLRVFAAASLSGAFRELARGFEEANPGAFVELSFAGSQVLRMQIAQGAGADVVALADRVHADALKRAAALRDHRVFARNALAVVTPAGHGRVRRLQDVARPGLRVVVAGPAVPVGRYTGQVIEKLSASGLFGRDFQRRVRANVVSQETNVRAVLAKVVLGEADAGFVYLTDARTAGGKVRVLEIPDRYNAVAEYPIAILSRSDHPRAAPFVQHVLGREGQGVLARYGFR